MLITEPKKFRALWMLLTCLPLLSGCAGLDAGRDLISGLSDTIFGEDDTADPPALLTEYTAEVQIDVLWKESVGNGADKQFLKLIPAVQNDRIFAADRQGTLQARNTVNGDLVWESESEYEFSAGPGLGRQTVIMGCTSGEVVAYDIASGEQKWISLVPSEVQAVPVAAKGMVIVRTTDGKVIALREADGSQLWLSEGSVPALSIRGAGAPVVIEDTVIIGSANGKMQALQLSDGKSLWEATIAMPTGRSEVERLVDLDVDPVASRGAIYISSFQGGTSSVSEVDGDVIWRNPDISSYTGISTDWRYLYLSDTHSEVSQLDQRNGASLWKQKDLHNRQLTAAVAYDNYVVVGDFEGYVHWLSTSDGRQLGRTQLTSSPIEAKPVIVDGTVYIYAKDGTLAALKAR
ncbi:outer membrane protein assembly factor BamB [Methylomonas sp. LL1]|uniref:outer membrane protein assembly factor BamB n=1 Tax=Methylomonas sp. LL1 TaxID=2785785 RepID=UPI0018C442B0|nr:outer membrane protein assembly factor BamB [Methylomonas sp. LL1]QPK63165.1 outer membrane protein assembly factor BamB [Methylomonas sp. LL1]